MMRDTCLLIANAKEIIGLAETHKFSEIQIQSGTITARFRFRFRAIPPVILNPSIS
jgi:hypothetical protein